MIDSTQRRILEAVRSSVEGDEFATPDYIAAKTSADAVEMATWADRLVELGYLSAKPVAYFVNASGPAPYEKAYGLTSRGEEALKTPPI